MPTGLGETPSTPDLEALEGLEAEGGRQPGVTVMIGKEQERERTAVIDCVFCLI